MNNQLIHGDSFEVLKSFPDNSFDAIITDPPYGINLDKWDSGVDIETLTKEVYRLLNDGFYAFFGQMPTLVEWLQEADNFFKYQEQIVWVKRHGNPSKTLNRIFENIFVYKKGNIQFYETKGKYEDVKIPHLYFNITTLEGMKRYICDLKLKIKESVSTRLITPSSSAINQSHFSYKRFTFNKSERSPDMCNFTNVWSFLPPNKAKRTTRVKHPTEKPLELMKRLIELTTPKNGIVLDPFGGSGTTALACLETGRRYVVIEKEQEYYEIAKQRIDDWEKENKQLELDVI